MKITMKNNDGLGRDLTTYNFRGFVKRNAEDALTHAEEKTNSRGWSDDGNWHAITDDTESLFLVINEEELTEMIECGVELGVITR